MFATRSCAVCRTSEQELVANGKPLRAAVDANNYQLS